MNNIIFTNKALSKMQGFGLSESHVMDAFNAGTVEKWSTGEGYNSVKKYTDYEIGVAWVRDSEGKYIITSVWKRNNRR